MVHFLYMDDFPPKNFGLLLDQFSVSRTENVSSPGKLSAAAFARLEEGLFGKASTKIEGYSLTSMPDLAAIAKLVIPGAMLNFAQCKFRHNFSWLYFNYCTYAYVDGLPAGAVIVPSFLTGRTTEQLLRLFKFGVWARNSALTSKVDLQCGVGL